MIRAISQLLLLLFVFIFCFCTLPSNKYPSVSYLHKTVIFDRSMTEEDIAATMRAIHSWECSTNGKAQFSIIKYPTEQNLADITDIDRSVIVSNVSREDSRITARDTSMAPGLYTVGLYLRSTSEIPIIILAKELIKPNTKEYELYIEHELGHALGLGHIENGMWPDIPIMDPNPSRSKGITKDDIAYLSQIYGIPFASMHACQ